MRDEGSSAINRLALGESGSLTDRGTRDRVRDLRTQSDHGMTAPAELFIGEVMDDADPQAMGRVWVFIPGVSWRSRDNETDGGNFEAKWVRAAPIFPFFGSNERRENTSAGSNINGGAPSDGYSTSYGFWGQPRIGDFVAIMFAGGSAETAYYFGCVPKYAQAFQVPGAAVDSADGEEFRLPGSEIAPERDGQLDRKAGYSLSQNLKRAGLQLDFWRGGGRSTSQRESPSRVYGMKTPGSQSTDGDVTSIGHQFVMDDLPADQGIRLRTSHGHQILFSDAKDVIYISTHQGNNWAELTGDGNIDFYAKKNFSIHCEEDFNLTVGRNMNINVAGEENKLIVGETHIEHRGAYHLTVTGAESDVTIKYEGEHHLTNVGQYTISNSDEFHVNTSGLARMSSGGNYSIKSGSNVHIDAASNVKQQQGLAQNADTATEPDLPTYEDRPGPPTAAQIANAEGGADVEYIAGTTESGRTPQHEPWHDVGEEDAGTSSSTDPYNVTYGSGSGEIAASSATTPGQARLFPDPNLEYQYCVVHCSATAPSAVSETVGWGGRPKSTSSVDSVRGGHLSKGWADVGYHWLVDRDGTVIQGRPEDVRGVHVAGINRYAIGVCLIGGLHPSGGYNWPDYTTAQLQSARLLIQTIVGRHPDIDLTTGVLGHWQAQRGELRIAGATGAKDCPCFDANKWFNSGDDTQVECTVTGGLGRRYFGQMVATHDYSGGNP